MANQRSKQASSKILKKFALGKRGVSKSARDPGYYAVAMAATRSKARPAKKKR